MTDNARAFVLLSGGIDSAVCLQKALSEHDDVAAIHFNYGQQTRERERRNAIEQTESADIHLYHVNYQDVFQHFAEGTIEDREYNHEKTVRNQHSVGYVPQRNLHLIASAAAVGEHNTKAGRPIEIFHGAQAGDAEEYPDCRPSFIQSVEVAINRGTEQHEISVRTPLIDKSKSEVITMGEELNINWDLTFSCYNDIQGKACGECPACLERKEAFAKAGIDDPILYAE